MYTSTKTSTRQYTQLKLHWKWWRRRKKWAEEEAEAKRKAEEAEVKHIAEEAWKVKEAEWECQTEEAWKAEVAAERDRVVKAQAEAEEAKKIQAANEALQAGIVAHEANKQRVAEEAAAVRVKAQALATCQKNLAKISVPPDNPLMQVPEGLELSREELRRIRKEVAQASRKWTLGEAEDSVSVPNLGSRWDWLEHF
jgi:hypothetical protein